MRLAIVGLVVSVVLIGAGLIIKKVNGGIPRSAYFLRKSLFTPSERSFLVVLQSLNLPGVTLAYKVRLADVFGIVKGFDSSVRMRALGRISARHVDFLLLQELDGMPLLGIELDESSHGDPKRVTPDTLVNDVFGSAQLPLVRIPARLSYNPSDVRAHIEAALKKRPER